MENLEKKLRNSMPECLVGADDPYRVHTADDFYWLTVHEIDLFEEGQDGCCKRSDIPKLKKFKAFCRENGATIDETIRPH